MVEGSPATYAAIRAWEIQLMVELNVDEKTYAQIPLKERARKLCAIKLPEWVGILESHRAMKEAEAKHGH